MGTSSNTPPIETQLQRRPNLAHRDAANTATENMTLDAQVKIVLNTGSSKNKKQPAIGSQYGRTGVDDCQLMI